MFSRGCSQERCCAEAPSAGPARSLRRQGQGQAIPGTRALLRLRRAWKSQLSLVSPNASWGGVTPQAPEPPPPPSTKDSGCGSVSAAMPVQRAELSRRSQGGTCGGDVTPDTGPAAESAGMCNRRLLCARLQSRFNVFPFLPIAGLQREPSQP